MTGQLEFASMLADAEAQRRAALDQHRHRVQTWFDELAASDKDQLAEWMTMLQWDTCVALSAAAGDWYRASLATHNK
jgi:hypothetical protein